MPREASVGSNVAWHDTLSHKPYQFHTSMSPLELNWNTHKNKSWIELNLFQVINQWEYRSFWYRHQLTLLLLISRENTYYCFAKCDPIKKEYISFCVGGLCSYVMVILLFYSIVFLKHIIYNVEMPWTGYPKDTYQECSNKIMK